MVIAAVNGTSKQGHQAVGLVLIQTRLAKPDEVGGVDIGPCGSAGCWVYVEVCRIVAEAT
jgi:hypothetical protein